MKKRTKLIALLMALVLVMGSMTACGSKDDSAATKAPETTAAATDDNGGSTEARKVKLTVWAPQEEQTDYTKVDAKYGKNLLKYMCEAFNEAHPEWDVEFKYAVCAEGDALTELSKDAAAGADVFMYAGDHVATLVNSGVLYPLTKDTEEIASNNTEVAMSAATIDSKLYGYPFSPNTWFMFYDKSKYSEEDVKSLETMMAKDLGKGVSNFSMPINNGWYNSSFFFSAGCSLFGENSADPTVCTFNDENGVKAAEYMIDLAKNEKFLADNNDKVAFTRFAKGTLGAAVGGTWDVETVKKALKDNYATAVLPTVNITGTDASLSPMGGYKYVGVNVNTADPEVAQALAAWLAGPECQKDRFLTRDVAPTWKTVLEDSAVSSDALTTLNAQMTKITVQPGIAQISNFWTPMEAFGNELVAKKLTKEKAKAELDKMVTNILAEVK